MKRLHPKYMDETEEEDTLIYSSLSEDRNEKKENKEDEDEIDPRWKELLKIRNQLN